MRHNTAIKAALITAVLAFLWRLPAAAVVWTDPILTPRVTRIRSVHVRELRTQANVLRANPAFGLSAAVWTDPDLADNSTKTRAIHIMELRQRIAEVYAAGHQTVPAWTDLVLNPNTTPLRAIHITELRRSIEDICIPGACTAAEPACDQTTYGANSCGSPCSKTGPACSHCIWQWVYGDCPPTHYSYVSQFHVAYCYAYCSIYQYPNCPDSYMTTSEYVCK